MAAGFHTLAISAWVQGDPSSASPAFFSSAPLAAALEGGIAAARVMAFQLARSPGSVPGRCHQTAFLAAVRTLTLQAAVARAGGAERVAEDAGAAMAYATAFAEAYPAGRKPVRDLLALFATAGLDLARGGSSPAARAVPDVLPPGAHGDAAVEELTRRFAATVMVSEELLGRVVGRAGEGDEAGGP
ncbi:hypothetical protein DFJ74DRAFT_677924 [Hyaloraphidium curvatum]|nr:hypothetical protein DFJ74DRAFT_677924 [Hyaloraphidium curvatum]